ncbi:hypothetical protein PVAND_012299 [Polypedilum vanderplanki]|uniref:Uncharacterized protein n=1 Tax=Polypedilum vanderplanki TaxID=319348 RepID=A0A9J6CL59_POLVA|nr:hypothetical protein PVAND_012299 [Polypedilum vanderplanki]
MNKATRTRKTSKIVQNAVDKAENNKNVQTRSNENASAFANQQKKTKGVSKRLLSAGDEVVRKRKCLESKTNKKSKRTKSEGANNDLFDSLYFDIVEAEKKIKNNEQLKRKAAKDKLKAVKKNISNSTPTNVKKKRKDVFKEISTISPINRDNSIPHNINEKSCDSVLIMRRNEIQRINEMMTPESNSIREIKEFIARKKEQMPKRSITINWNFDSENSVHNETPHDSLKKSQVSTGLNDVEQNKVTINGVNDENEADDEVFEKTDEDDNNQIESVNEIKISQDQDSCLSVPEFNSIHKTEESILIDDKSNLIENIESKQKIVKFNEPELEKTDNISKVKLKPGKWRKSLVAWRKSHNMTQTRNEGSRKFSVLFPIKTDPTTIKRYTMRIQQTLEKSVEQTQTHT